MDEFERVKSVIVDQLGADESAITMDASFVDDLGADSLDIVELIMGLETEFDIEIPATEIIPENFNSAKGLWDMVQRLLDEE